MIGLNYDNTVLLEKLISIIKNRNFKSSYLTIKEIREWEIQQTISRVMAITEEL